MTRDEIDDLMRDNGIVVVGEAVYALVQLVIDAEREACAKICDEYDTTNWLVYGEHFTGLGDDIRSRSNT